MSHQASEPFNPISPSPSSFGEWLRRQRKLRDLTQDDLAQRVGCARVTIRKFESDETRASKQMAELLAQALDVPVAEREAFVQFARGAQTIPAQPLTRTPSARTHHNLPLQPTSLIGREHDVAEVKRLLATTHLLTLTGSGGTGKTRLSLQVAAEILDSYADGVWLVELAPLADPSLVILTIASVLGVRQEPDRPLLSTLLDWLRDKQLLLILDNCEHLIEACAQFADAVLRASRETRILASSREALGIAGELAWRVPSLEIPNPTEIEGASPAPATQGNRKGLPLQDYASVRLFVERASFANASFALTDANVNAIVQICYRLDGIPLAIELAAARTKVMHVEQIADRLDDRFRLLTGGSRTALPRQQTLRGMIDWSFSLLTEPERVLLRRLSVFAGGWTLDAAEAVCGDAVGASVRPPLPAIDLLDHLTHLVEKSLVVPDEKASETRYRMLETVRQYAREKLLDAGESERLRDRHLSYFLNLAEHTAPILFTAQRVEWMPRLELEHDNMSAALLWACERDHEVARWLAGQLGPFWSFAGHLNVAHGWYERVLALDDHTVKTPGMALALLSAGEHSAIIRLADDHRYLERSITLWRELDDKPRTAEGLTHLAFLLVRRGRSEEACSLCEASEVLIRQYAQPWVLARFLNEWGRALAHGRSDFDSAKALLDESLTLGKQLGLSFLIGSTYSNMGHWAMQKGDYEAARTYHYEGLIWQRRNDMRWSSAAALANLADTIYLLGEYEQANLLYRESEELFRAVGMQGFVARIVMRLGKVALKLNDTERAARLINESLTIGRQLSDQRGPVICLEAYAELKLAQGSMQHTVSLLALKPMPSALQGTALVERIEYDRTLAAARAALSPAAFAAAWAAGQALTLDQAVALAMEDVHE